MWNVVDFTTNSLYVATVSLRLVAYYRVQVRLMSNNKMFLKNKNRFTFPFIEYMGYI